MARPGVAFKVTSQVAHPTLRLHPDPNPSPQVGNGGWTKQVCSQNDLSHHFLN